MLLSSWKSDASPYIERQEQQDEKQAGKSDRRADLKVIDYIGDANHGVVFLKYSL